MTDFSELYKRNNPLLQELKNIKIEELHNIIETFINDHINKNDYRFKDIFDNSKPLLKIEYKSLELREIKYLIEFYDYIEVDINYIGIILFFKKEHQRIETLIEMNLDRFFELYIKKI